MLQTISRRMLQRKLGSYMVFAQETREQVKQSLPEGSNKATDVAKALGERWKLLSDAEKQAYKEKEIVAKPKKTVSTTVAMLRAARANLDENEPKLPQSAFSLFYADFPSVEDGKFINGNDRLKAGRAAFAALSQDDKDKFNIEQQRQELRYEKEMREYIPAEGKITRAQYQNLLRDTKPASQGASFNAGKAVFRRELAELKGCKIKDLKAAEVTAGWSKLDDTQKAVYEGRAMAMKK